jgi:hypothetical protein
MRGLEKVLTKEIYINGKEIRFDYEIDDVVIGPDKIFVCLSVLDYIKIGKDIVSNSSEQPIMKIVVNDRWREFRDTSKDVEGDNLNRVYCYDYEGNLVWQLKTKKFYDDFRECSIASIRYDYDNNKFFTRDYWGRDFDINLETGEPMSFKAERF